MGGVNVTLIVNTRLMDPKTLVSLIQVLSQQKDGNDLLKVLLEEMSTSAAEKEGRKGRLLFPLYIGS